MSTIRAGLVFIFFFTFSSGNIFGQVPNAFYQNWESIPQEATNRTGLEDTLVTNGPKLLLENHDLFDFGLITADEEGNIAGFDYGLWKIVYIEKSNSTLDIRLLGNGKGRGPQEFQSPRDVKVDEKGNIWIADTQASRITKWSPQGKLLDTIAPNNQFLVPARIAICADNQLYILSDQYGGKGVIHHLDSQKNKTTSFQQIEDKMQRFSAYMEGEVSCNENQFFMAGRFKNYIRKYNARGTLLFSRSVVTFEPNEEPLMKKEGRWFSRSEDAVRASGDVSAVNDKVYVGFSGKEDGWQYVLDVYNADNGNYLRSFAFNTPVSDFEVMANNKIVVVEYNYETKSRQVASYGIPE